MYKLLIKKRTSKNWKQLLIRKTVGYAKNWLIRTHSYAEFLAGLYQNECYETRVKKVN